MLRNPSTFIRYRKPTLIERVKSWFIKLPMNKERVLRNASPIWNERLVKK